MKRHPLLTVLLLGLAACSSPMSQEADTPAAEATADAVPVSVVDFMIEPMEIEVDGPTVSFAVTNDGPTPHNFTVRNTADEIVAATADLAVGSSETISANLEPGSYTIFCSLAGHESLGMRGTLTVLAP